MKLLIINFLLLISFGQLYAQGNFYDPATIQKIEIFFSQPDWNHQMHVLKITTEGYLKADSVKINGNRFINVGVKYKGNSSYDSTWTKNPLHIALDKYEDQDYQGYNDIKLSNCFEDPSMIREVLSYQILAKYMECSQANFAKVYINGAQYGLYSSIEDVGKGFCARRFKSAKTNSFIKCSPILTPGPNVKSNLRYLGADSSLYFNYYEIKSSKGWNHFVDLCSTATHNPAGLKQILDMDRFAWMLAFDNVLVNLDSYIGAFAQNYYVFRDNNGIFNPVVWDLNMSFAGFPFAGSSNTSLGTLSIAQAKQLPLNLHQTDAYWPVINAFHASDRYKKMYHAHIRTMMNEVFANGLYDTMASRLRATIDTAVLSDPHKFFTHSDFQNSMTTDISVGTYLVPGIRNLMAARTAYLQARPELLAAPPSISAHPASYSEANGEITVTATLENHSDTSVYLGFRADSTRKFQRIRMYDDGLHGDGVAGDLRYGAVFISNPATAEYYLYAENENAATFLPERAEYEFFKVSVTTSADAVTSARPGFFFVPNPASDQVVIKLPNHGQTQLQVTDVLGKLVINQTVKAQDRLDVSSWKSGIYTVRIGAKTQKLVVAH